MILEIWKIRKITSVGELLASVLKKDSSMDVLPTNFQKLSEQLSFRNRSGRMRLEIQTAFILKQPSF